MTSEQDEAPDVDAVTFVESWLNHWGVAWPHERANQLVGDMDRLYGVGFRAVGRITDFPMGVGAEWLEGVSYDDDPTLDDGVILYVKTDRGGMSND